ncbi:MAG TPA: hypothetical protein VGM90_20995 [Kofleriaceae bacterium]|jgi:hypothetical protein
MSRSTNLLCLLAVAAGLASAPSIAAPRAKSDSDASARELALTDLVMGEKDDARTAIAIGPTGEVYTPSKGAWTRTQAITTSDKVSTVGRSGDVVVLADGAVYKLADNGWSALRLTQKGKAVMSSGARSVGAVGRQLFALDRSVNGEPQKLGEAPSNVLAIGASEKSIVIATDKGLFRSSNAATTGIATTGVFKPIARAPKRVDRLLDDRFALIDRGVVDLDSGAVTAWPAGFRVGTATVVVASRTALDLDGASTVSSSAPIPDDPPAGGKGPNAGKGKKAPKSPPAKKGSGALVIAVGTLRGTPTLVVVDGATVQTETIDLDANASSAEPSRKSLPLPVGVAADRAGRIAVAFASGAIAVREKKAWTASMISEALPADKPGAPPARSGPAN